MSKSLQAQRIKRALRVVCFMPSLQDSLLRWYAAKGRDLPWRKTRDPYAILVSEVMLQQTQVDRVVSKYEAWLARYPDWKRLAAASRADVLKVWSGLGYNNRALRLHALAKTLVEQHGSKLPETEEELRKLPGIGPYTAGAITVFSYNRPGLCIDVNIERIVKRAFFTRRQHLTKEQLATTFLRSFPKGRATDWGNALMDLGSVVCTPSTPNCAACPLSHGCRSRGERPEERSELFLL